MPQPRHTDKDQEPQTAADLGGERATPKPDDDKPTFAVGRLREEGGVILGLDLHDVRAAFVGVPASREVSAVDARKRVNEWLKAPVETHETPQPDRAR